MECLVVDPVIHVTVLCGASLLVEGYEKHVGVGALDDNMPSFPNPFIELLPKQRRESPRA